jgi:undecaprenyl-phosphate galactose phosphotransferase/putative colanic acid biosynthesis UDP-glucose lipid carrier transferase
MLLSFVISSKRVFVDNIPDISYFILPFIGCNIIWFLFSIHFNLYDNSKNIYTHNVISKNSIGLFFFSLASSGYIFLVTTDKFSRIFLVYALTIHAIFILIWRIFFFLREKAVRKKGVLANEVVVVGYNENIAKIIEEVYTNPLFGYKLKALFTEEKSAFLNKGITKTGDLNSVIDYLEHNNVKELLISLPQNQSDLTLKLLKIADNNLIKVKIIPDFSGYLSQMFSMEYIGNVPVLKLRNDPLRSISNRILKRSIDLTLSTIALVFLFSWLFPIISIVIKLTSKGPIFFKQQRTGKDGRTFNCLKFRSMKVNSESDTKQAVKGDSRVTRIGAFLRKTSLDELPQVFNVLLNDMSFVGPRPHMLKHTDEYKEVVDKFMVRHYAKPGITGWAQINGYRGETKELIEMEKRAEADIWYIENWSIFLDIKIIFSTCLMLIKKDNNVY